MDNFIRKRIDIATCWATNRISAMDTLERYEDSYAIAEEFREWILHIGEKNENLKDSVLNFPKELKKLSAGLTKKGCTKKYEKVVEKLGRLKEKYRKINS